MQKNDLKNYSWTFYIGYFGLDYGLQFMSPWTVELGWHSSCLYFSQKVPLKSCISVLINNLLCAFLDISLQPYIDTRAGTLDTWPAHALGPSPPDLNPISATKQTNEFMPKGVHKPKFLEQLEAFLQKELRSLDCAEMIPSERRLQVSMSLQEELIWKPFLPHWLQRISIRFLFLKLHRIGHLGG